MGILMINTPQKDIFTKDKNMYSFIETTDKNCVFAAYHGNYRLDIPNIAKRAIFSGNGFPFNESYFKKYQSRKELMSGTRKDIDKIEGSWEGEKVNNFFRTKRPKDFLKISQKYKLDYIVIENEYSSNFKNYSPNFENNKVKIYKISDFKEHK